MEDEKFNVKEYSNYKGRSRAEISLNNLTKAYPKIAKQSREEVNSTLKVLKNESKNLNSDDNTEFKLKKT